MVPSAETAICARKQKVTERVGVSWDGDRCTAPEDMTVEICIDFAVEKPKIAAEKPGGTTSEVGDP